MEAVIQRSPPVRKYPADIFEPTPERNRWYAELARHTGIQNMLLEACMLTFLHI